MATINNLDALELSEEEQTRLEQMLLDALAEDSQDVELKSYLMGFVDNPNGDITLDAQELWQAEVIKERFEEYSASLAPEAQDDLLSAFGDFGEDMNAHPSPEELEGAPDLSAWDEPLPESNLEVPPAFDQPEVANEAVGNQSVEQHEPSAEEAPAPELEQETTASADELQEPAQLEAEAAQAAQTPENEDERLLKLIDALGPALSARAEGGGGPSEDSGGSFLNTIKNVAATTLGAAAGTGGAVAGAAAGAAAGTAAAASSAVASRLRGAVSGEGEPIRADDMSQLRGEPVPDNVVDIRDRLGKSIGSMDKESVQNRVALMGDQHLMARSNALLSTIEEIDKGAPDGRYSQMDLGDGMKLGSVLELTESDDPAVATMAKAFSARSDFDAAGEMEFLSCEYQEVAEALESTVEHARKQGWSDEEIAEQFGAPVDEWLEKRTQEDANLAKLADLQDNDLSPEEVAERQDAMEKMAEKLKELLDKLLGRSKENEQTQGASMSR
ncbi:hypothetical protein [Marinimicrobium sp. ABcell2]|uniref:hypothetical protein n=1 Tax=Marinimicrobium sp. ABcell2 TaxID=3069751 RepID=UPI0027B760BE|nr:hypothetical protein [Marinimicrobium sp. ABcell2]MDQ2077530.1 hypothetical protein [Marinimicrobium sp. ABcell2]